jgi:hypothetical protein
MTSSYASPIVKQTAAYRYQRPPGPAEAPVQVRAAGRGAMRDKPPAWEKYDETVDESFPASDPPSANRFD